VENNIQKGPVTSKSQKTSYGKSEQTLVFDFQCTHLFIQVAFFVCLCLFTPLAVLKLMEIDETHKREKSK